MKAPETSAWARARAAMSLAAGVANQELKHRVRSSLSGEEGSLASEWRARIEQARILADGMGRLKGAFMKAGQLISMDGGEFLPEEARDILSKLQAQAEPVDFAVLDGVLRSELGDAYAELQHLDPSPAASASIGQVHRATVDGRPVAVKVQYPGVVESIDADMRLLRTAGNSMMKVSRRDVDLSDLFQEMSALLHLEADYVREAFYMARFAEALRDDARFIIPSPVSTLSTQRVLTMSWEEGERFTSWLSAHPSREDREHVARALLDLYCIEFFQLGMVQTDPNPGNFLVRTREGERPHLVLLDFGATMEFDATFRETYTRLLRTVRSGDRAAIAREGVAFNLIDAREAPATFDLFVDMMLHSVGPFQREAQPFSFADAGHSAEEKAIIQGFIRSLRFSPPPRHLIFLHRKLGGLFQMLRRLGVALDLVPYWERMVADR